MQTAQIASGNLLTCFGSLLQALLAGTIWQSYPFLEIVFLDSYSKDHAFSLFQSNVWLPPANVVRNVAWPHTTQIHFSLA